MSENKGKKPRSFKRTLSKLWRRLPRITKQEPLLQSLPVEIHDRIATFLPPLSQACMALTCRQLYEITYSEALCSPDLRFPKSFQPRIGGSRRSECFISERWKLLQYLENKRWRSCSRCLKLHPVSEFSHKNLRGIPEKRFCIMGKNAGIVELCPCVKLTYRDKLKLIQQLRLDPKRPRSLSELDLSDGSKHIWHQCDTTGHYSFTTKIFPVLEGEELQIVTTYDIYQPKDLSNGWEKLPVRPCCPHLTALTYVFQVQKAQNQPNARFVVPYSISSKQICCRWCTTRVGRYEKMTLENSECDKISFKTTRHLGLNVDVTDLSWLRQSVYSSDPPRDQNHFDRTPFYGLARFRPDLFPGLTLDNVRNK